MKTIIRPIRNPDSGETVFFWQVFQNGKLVAGGYGATEQDARNVAQLTAEPLKR